MACDYYHCFTPYPDGFAVKLALVGTLIGLAIGAVVNVWLK